MSNLEPLQEEPTVEILLLRVLYRENEVDCRAFMVKEKISIGRDPYTDVYIEDPMVSRLHAVIERDNGLTLRDRSSNGTVVNGKPVTSHALAHNDVITVGRFSIIVEIHRDAKSSLFDQAQSEGWTMDDARTIPKSA